MEQTEHEPRISCQGILSIHNLWILLRNVIHLVVQKFHLHGLFRCQSCQGSDVIVGTLLEKKVFVTENYTSFSLFLVCERIQRELLRLKACQIDVYSMPCPLVPTMTSLPVKILTAKNFTNMIFLNDKMCYVFSQKNPKIMNTQNPQI